ncbi:40S ribosomal protein, partial [Linnemannia gamsii]
MDNGTLLSRIWIIGATRSYGHWTSARWEIYFLKDDLDSTWKLNILIRKPPAQHTERRGGFGRGRGRGGDRGRGRGRGRGGKDEKETWTPVTKLGRLVKDRKIQSIEQIYLFSLPIKEYQIVDYFLPSLKDEVMKIMPVQKQTRAGQRTRFKAFVVIGDSNGH